MKTLNESEVVIVAGVSFEATEELVTMLNTAIAGRPVFKQTYKSDIEKYVMEETSKTAKIQISTSVTTMFEAIKQVELN